MSKKIESLCRKAVLEHDMLEKERKIAVALSGGKDSMTLLYMLKQLSSRGFPPLDIHAIHVSGSFSCGPSLTLKHLLEHCQKLGVALHVCESTKTLKELECYSCSRIRRKLLFDKAKALGIHCIAFGHHLDDEVQTLLMNLLHKAEFAALLPKILMHDYDIRIIRPLIYVSEEQIQSFAKKQGFARITCRCPVGQNSMRQKVKDLILEMETLFENSKSNLAKAAKSYGSRKALEK